MSAAVYALRTEWRRMRGFAPSMRAVAIISALTSATANAIGRFSFLAASMPAAIAFSASSRPRLKSCRIVVPLLEHGESQTGRYRLERLTETSNAWLGRLLQRDGETRHGLFPFVAKGTIHACEVGETATRRFLPHIGFAVP